MTSRGKTKLGVARFSYWICKTDSQETTPFQGFRRREIEIAPILKYVTTLPSNVFELFAEKSRAAFARMNGVSEYAVRILDPSYFDNLKLWPGNPFSVFISDSNTSDAVEAYQRSCRFPSLHVTTADKANVLQLSKLGRAELNDLYGRVLQYLEKSGEPEMVLLPNAEQAFVTWDLETLDLPERDHGATVPNEMCLKSLRFQLGRLKPLPAVVVVTDSSPSVKVNSRIIQALRESVEEIRTQRTRFSSLHEGPSVGSPIDAVVWASGVASRLSETVPRQSPGAPKGLSRLLRALLRQADYPGFTNLSAADAEEMFASDAGKQAVVMRKVELELCAAGLGVLAAGHFAPVIRIRPAVNLVRGQMKQIAACAIANGPRSRSKLSQLTHTLEDKLAEEVGDDCMDLLKAAGEGIKLVSNAPLEFIPLQGLPLQLQRTVSRVPVTPGSLLLSHLIGVVPSIYLSPSDLKSVLIVRSFKEDDPIRSVLSIASEAFLDKCAGKLNVTTVDVQTANEFVDAVNAFSGNILIFDGHGTHDTQKQSGLLQIGTHSIHPLDLAGKIRRMPPIIVLSACSTHPLEWSDGSAATGFLMLGAISVLATVTPISALHAAVFTGRLLLRLAEFVPLIAGSGQRWSHVITGLLRMSYVTDILRSFERRGWLSEEKYSEIHVQANADINSGKSGWFEGVLASTSEKTGISPIQVENSWRTETYFTSTLQYVHLGSPEKITIVEE